MRKLLVILIIAAFGAVAYFTFQNNNASTGTVLKDTAGATKASISPIAQIPTKLSASTKTPASAPSAPEPTATAYTGSGDLVLINVFNQLKDAYNPEKLVNLFEQKDRSFQLARSDIELSEKAYLAANKMFKAAKKDGVEGFIISSGYRSRAKQQELWDARVDDTVVMPGASEHETGLAFDVTAMNSEKGFDTTQQFKWLSKHCYEYGFILRYPKDKESITGVPYEPWHYRYVGEVAKEIHEGGYTLEEYIDMR